QRLTSQGSRRFRSTCKARCVEVVANRVTLELMPWSRTAGRQRRDCPTLLTVKWKSPDSGSKLCGFCHSLTYFGRSGGILQKIRRDIAENLAKRDFPDRRR